MGESNNQINPVTKWGLTITNLGLALIFIWNLTRLNSIHQTVQDSLQYPILSENGNEFISKIQAADVQWWVWAGTSLAVVISLLLLLGLMVPAFAKYSKWAVNVSYAWLALWILYVVVIVAIGLSAFNSIFT